MPNPSSSNAAINKSTFRLFLYLIIINDFSNAKKGDEANGYSNDD